MACEERSTEQVIAAYGADQLVDGYLKIVRATAARIFSPRRQILLDELRDELLARLAASDSKASGRLAHFTAEALLRGCVGSVRSWTATVILPGDVSATRDDLRGELLRRLNG